MIMDKLKAWLEASQLCTRYWNEAPYPAAYVSSRCTTHVFRFEHPHERLLGEGKNQLRMRTLRRAAYQHKDKLIDYSNVLITQIFALN